MMLALMASASATEAVRPVITLDLATTMPKLDSYCLATEAWQAMIADGGAKKSLRISGVTTTSNSKLVNGRSPAPLRPSAIKLPKGCDQRIYAKKCVLSNDQHHKAPASCKTPTAVAYDHHEGKINVDTVTVLNVISQPNKYPPQHKDQVVSQVSKNKRAEFLIEYEALDTSGNEADRTYFVMIFEDHNSPEAYDKSGNKVSGDALSGSYEARGANGKYSDLFAPPMEPHSISDFYDNDALKIENTRVYNFNNGKVITSGKQAPKTNINARQMAGDATATKGSYSFKYTYHDFASIFGASNYNNKLTLTGTIAIEDTTEPKVFCGVAANAKGACEVSGNGKDIICKEGGKNLKQTTTTCPEDFIHCLPAQDHSDKAATQKAYFAKAKAEDKGAIAVDVYDDVKCMVQGNKEKCIVHDAKPAKMDDVSCDNCYDDSTGEVTLTYTAEDNTGNSQVVTRKFAIADASPPTLNLVTTGDFWYNSHDHSTLECGPSMGGDSINKLLILWSKGFTVTKGCAHSNFDDHDGTATMAKASNGKWT
jgi:hypothetical protein